MSAEQHGGSTGLDPAGWEDLARLKRILGVEKSEALQGRVWSEHIATTHPALRPPLYPNIWKAVLQAFRDAVTH